MSYILADSGEWGVWGPSEEIAKEEKSRRLHLLQQLDKEQEALRGDAGAIQYYTNKAAVNPSAADFSNRQIAKIEQRRADRLCKIEAISAELTQLEVELEKLDPDWFNEAVGQK